MNKILFSKYGTFLSGRSLSTEIISKEKINPLLPIELDFHGIPAANQSFLNQLFLDLAHLGFSWKDLVIVNAIPDILTQRIEDQLNIVFENRTSLKMR